MSVFSNSVDMSVRCNLCKSYLSLASVESHKKYHEAMRIMRYKSGQEPSRLEALCKRKKTLVNQIVKKYQKSDIQTKLERINYAFEFLRTEMTHNNMRLHALLPQNGMSTMRDGFFEERDRVKPDNVKSICVDVIKDMPSIVSGIAHSHVCQMKGEDCDFHSSATNTFQPNEATKSLFLSLFDGYHGNNASKKCEENFHNILKKEIYQASFDNVDLFAMGDGIFTHNRADEEGLVDEQILKCLKQSYLAMDKYLSYGVDEHSRVRFSGTSALTLLIKEDFIPETENSSTECNANLFVTNAGDVQGVLYHHNKSFNLSRLHTTKNQSEVARILDSGGQINSSDHQPLVCGAIKQTRGLGNHGDVKLKKSVIPSPYACSTKLNQHSQILVLASSPVWQAFNHEDVLSIILHAVPTDIRSSMVLHGPTPITPILHKAPHSETPEIIRQRGIASSELPSIVETEEEDAIAEVVIVHGFDTESTDSEAEDETSSLEVFEQENLRRKADEDLINKRNETAKIMAEQLVRACVHAKVKGHISVTIVLLNGFFQ